MLTGHNIATTSTSHVTVVEKARKQDVLYLDGLTIYPADIQSLVNETECVTDVVSTQKTIFTYLHSFSIASIIKNNLNIKYFKRVISRLTRLFLCKIN